MQISMKIDVLRFGRIIRDVAYCSFAAAATRVFVLQRIVSTLITTLTCCYFAARCELLQRIPYRSFKQVCLNKSKSEGMPFALCLINSYLDRLAILTTTACLHFSKQWNVNLFLAAIVYKIEYYIKMHRSEHRSLCRCHWILVSLALFNIRVHNIFMCFTTIYMTFLNIQTLKILKLCTHYVLNILHSWYII